MRYCFVVLVCCLIGCTSGQGSEGRVDSRSPSTTPGATSTDTAPTTSTSSGPCEWIGYADEPLEWSLPQFDGDVQLYSAYDFSCNEPYDAIHDVRDLNGDGSVDLLLYDYCGDLGAEQLEQEEKQWRVYFNTGTGFTPAPDVWVVPDAHVVMTPDTDYSGSRSRPILLQDRTGDGLPDLVFRGDGRDEPGLAAYDVYAQLPTGGFSLTPVPYSLPGPVGAFDGSEPWTCDENAPERPVFRWMNLVGDGRLDLVVLRECDGDLTSEVGDSHYLVYEGLEAGVAEEPVQWGLPEPPNPQMWGVLSGAEIDWEFSLIDITGDGKLDIFVTYDRSGKSSVGAGLWWVFEGTETGFEPAPRQWNLPGASSDFSSLNGTCSSARYLYRVVDMTGDGRPDLVVTEDCEDATPGLGEQYWHVFMNRGDSFAPTPIVWQVPTLPGRELVDSTRDDIHCGSPIDFDRQDVRYVFSDVTGDGVADLIHTSNCDELGRGEGPVVDPAIGTEIWYVYPAVCL